MNMLRFHDWSLKWKSNFLFLLLVMIPTTVFGGIVLVQIHSILREQAVESTERILDTLSQNISSIVANVEDISSFMIYDDQFRRFLTGKQDGQTGMREYRNLLEHVNAFATFQVLSKRYINSIELQGINGVHTEIGEKLAGDETLWTQAAKEAGGGVVWSGAYRLRSVWNGENKYVISLLRQVNDINNISSSIGLLRIRLDEQSIYSLISTKGVPQSKGKVFLMNRQGLIISHKDKPLLGQLHPDPLFIRQVTSERSGFTYTDNSGTFLVVTRKMEQADWYLVAMVNQSSITDNLDIIRSSIEYMVILSTVLWLVAFFAFYYFIIRPILELTTLTRQVERGNLDTKVTVRSNDEIGMLGNRFNKMIGTIQRLINTKYKLEIQQKESELKALQNQIDPHFLYNTLDMIRWTARLEKALDTSRLIEALSRLFRISLSRGKLWIPLGQELEYVRNYLILQEKRLGQGLHYSIHVDPDLEEALVLKMIIQPIVENCIVHGFPALDEPGRIEIRCSSGDGQLFIDVLDNGKGLSSPETANDADQGYALRNIQERLSLLFGARSAIRFLQRETGGAWVRITLPLIRSEQEMNALIGKENLYEREDPNR